jgi:hypothetical protein
MSNTARRCSAERLSGMIINRAPMSRRAIDPSSLRLIVDGVVQVDVYLKRLTDITAKFHTMEDPQATSAQAYESALGLDRELRVLASQTPRLWWSQDLVKAGPDNLCQLLHYYFMMRVHLPFTMRQREGDGHGYSRLACLEACEAVAQRYYALRRLLPSGIFLSPIMDIQALTATVTLLLTTHSGDATERRESQENKAKVHELTTQVLTVMEEKSGDAAGGNFARQGAMAIRSLQTLLKQSDGASVSRQLNLKVPLLGSLNIRRNLDLTPAKAPTSVPQQATQVPAETGLWNPHAQPLSQPFDNAAVTTYQHPQPVTQGPADWQWNPLSWSVEATPDNMLQDGFMVDSMDPFGTWQGDYTSFQM